MTSFCILTNRNKCDTVQNAVRKKTIDIFTDIDIMLKNKVYIEDIAEEYKALKLKYIGHPFNGVR